MKVAGVAYVAAALASVSDAFVAPSVPRARAPAAASRGMHMMATKVTVPELLVKTEELQLLSKAAELGLLGKLEKAGLTLKDVEKLLPLVDELDLITFAQGAGDTLLPLAPKALDLAPSLLPLASVALGVPAPALFAAAAASLAAGVGALVAIPDDSVSNIALQAFLAVPLIAILPVVSAGGGVLLSKLGSGSSGGSFAPSAPVVALPAVAGGRVKVSAAPKAAAAKKSAVKVAPKKAAAPKPAPKPAARRVKVVAAAKGKVSNIPKKV